jgi:HAD superfamily hydrolase (TIGR01549 family)
LPAARTTARCSSSSVPASTSTPGRHARLDAGLGEYLNGHDLYPDVRPCLQALKDAGYFVGIAGNQSSQLEEWTRGQELPVDVVGSSASWGVEKPSAEFFARVVEASGAAPHEVAYVGDRLDNDVLPARAAGLVAVQIRRGPWAYLQGAGPLCIGSLDELPKAFDRG